MFIVLFDFLSAPTYAAFHKSATDSLLSYLDIIVDDNVVYYSKKERRLADLQKQVFDAGDNRARFDALNNLFGEYHSYNADSAYAISQRQLMLARKIGDNNLIINALLNIANILGLVGMYHETLGIVDSIPNSEIPDYLRPYYYHTKRTVYGNLADFAAFAPEKEYYSRLTDQYRDSLLMVNDSASIFHVLIKADQLNVHNKPHQAIKLLEDFIEQNKLPDHEAAICAFTLSDSYRRVNDVENQKKQLIISAISDMKTHVKEYVALRQLALLLYQEGDLERAYKFLTRAVADASKSNARQRIVELNDSYPTINGIYVETVRNQKRNLEYTIIIITVLTLILICLLIYMRKQMLKIADGRLKVEVANYKLNDVNGQLKESVDKLNEVNGKLLKTNEKLNELNAKLVQSNNKLQDAYTAIAEISELKEVYICQYMDRSLEYIELLDTYRKNIGKLVNAGKTKELQKIVKSTKLVDDELKTFYYQFDQTFLNLFPSFVEDLNSLLLPEEAIIPKKPGSLNAELRIFALIRLGITDSDKIAKFLRYSLTTIYNYRSKVRNKSRGDRNSLENEVMKIGRASS